MKQIFYNVRKMKKQGVYNSFMQEYGREYINEELLECMHCSHVFPKLFVLTDVNNEPHCPECAGGAWNYTKSDY